MNAIIAKPSAWLPLLMSTAALAIVLIHLALAGTIREIDEGTAAHLFQLLIAAQAPCIACFAVIWLRRRPRPAMRVLALQMLAIAVALAPVFYFHL
jgi:hypothetical protein